MKTLTEIESLIVNRQLDNAETAIEEFLEQSPTDAEARMLFGVCQQMMGRTEAFCEVYRDLAPSMSVRDALGEDSHVMTSWRHYCKVASYLVAIGVITLVGTVSAESVSNRMDKIIVSQTTGAKPSEVVTDVAQFKNLPRGVQNIKYDESGAISTLMIVGKKTLPKALRRNPGRAAQYGSNAARSEAQLELARFLSSKCKWGKTADGIASVSGIQVLWEGLNDSGEYVWVGAWNANALKTDLGTVGNMETEPATKYAMGGKLVELMKVDVGTRPATKYAMGGKLLNTKMIDDDF